MMEKDVKFPQWFLEKLEHHEEGKYSECGCDFRDGGYGLCLAGQYIEGSLDKEGFISLWGIE